VPNAWGRPMVNFTSSTTKDGRWTAIGLLLSGGLYVISFLLPTCQFVRDGETDSGWEAFRTVMERLFRSPALSPPELLSILPMWLSNPFLWAGIVLWAKGRWRWSAFAGMLAMIGGSLLPDRPGTFVFLPGGIFRADNGLLAGYFVWLGSMLVLVVFSIVRILIAK